MSGASAASGLIATESPAGAPAADQSVAPQQGLSWPGFLAQRQCVILVVDRVESVRQIERHGAAAVAQWAQWMAEVRTNALPAVGARLVKSTGDGLMAECPDAASAMALAQALHAQAAVSGRSSGIEPLALRAAVHVADVMDDGLDLYGRDANLAARAMAQAAPCQTVITEAVRDRLSAAAHAELEDLGDCHLKGVDQPLRLFALGAATPPYRLPVEEPPRPRLALVADLRSADADAAMASWVAEAVTARLARCRHLRLISSLSCGEAARSSTGDAMRMASTLQADWVAVVRCRASGQLCAVTWELVHAVDGTVQAADQLVFSASALFDLVSPPIEEIAGAVLAAADARTIQAALLQPPENLDAYTLQAGAIALMHCAAPQAFQRGGDLLRTLIDRYPRMVGARVWLAKWHVLRVTRGLATDRADEASYALAHTRFALQRQPHDPLALAVEGFVHCHMRRDLAQARARLDSALDSSPNEPLAWLFSSVVNAFEGRGGEAMHDAAEALARSPADPLQHYFYSLAATAALAARDDARALDLARRAYRMNRQHASTLRAMAIAQIRLGMHADAQQTMHSLRRLQPGLTVRAYREGFPGGSDGVGLEWSRALRAAGLPD